MKPLVFSGVQPTGELHLGNYLGALKNWVHLQSKYTCMYSIVDFHALTTITNPDELRKLTWEAAVDLLSIGVDPKKSTFFRQSDVLEHAELNWLFSCITPVPELERMTQYKDLVQKHKKVSNAGMLMYPVLMAADILLYKASHVPVGDDQIQHLELTRIIARKFNNRFGDFFPEVEPILSEDIRVMSLNDPMKKMSKSLGPSSYIALRDNPEVVNKKISKAVTDSLNDNTTLGGGHNLLTLYKHFGPQGMYDQYIEQYKLKKLSYATLKQELADSVNQFLKPIQEKQAYYEKHPAVVEQILKDGAKRARSIAQKNIKEVRKLVGLD